MQRPQALAELAIGLRARLTIRSYLPSRGLHLKRETSPDMFEGFPRLRVALPEPSPLPPATSRVPGGRANLMIYFSESRSGTLLPLSGFDRRTGDSLCILRKSPLFTTGLVASIASLPWWTT